MSKQLLIYSRAKPLNSKTHRELSIKSGASYAFAADVNSVPLTAVEFSAAAEQFPIVFAGTDEQIMPLVVMGVRDGENVFVNAAGEFTANYVPAFLRRYPFVFSSQDDGKNFTVCIDESFEGFNTDNLGERLFDGEGEQTQFLKNVTTFLQEYQVSFTRTQAFCKKLKELDLLEPMGAQFTPAEGEQVTLTGFSAINRQKLKELSEAELTSLVKTDGMELIYLHLYSLRNFTGMVEKMPASEPDAEAV